MPQLAASAVIHQARQVGEQRSGARDSQGAFVMEDFTGPWIPARLMERGSVAAKTQFPGSMADRVQRGYELLLAPFDENGDAIDRPTASVRFETNCPVLNSPTVQLDGEPEVLTNGTDVIGYLCYADVIEDRS